MRASLVQVVMKAAPENVPDLKEKKNISLGSPISQYAISREGPDTLLVWVAHQSALDAWTIRLICEDLKECIYGIEAYNEKPPRPSFRAYIEWLKTVDVEKAKQTWSKLRLDFVSPQTIFTQPLGGRVDSVSTIRSNNREIPSREMAYQQPSQHAHLRSYGGGLLHWQLS